MVKVKRRGPSLACSLLLWHTVCFERRFEGGRKIVALARRSIHARCTCVLTGRRGRARGSFVCACLFSQELYETLCQSYFPSPQTDEWLLNIIVWRAWENLRAHWDTPEICYRFVQSSAHKL